MQLKTTFRYFWIVIVGLGLFACKSTQPWKGQAPIVTVPTTTLPIQKQYKGTFDLGEGIYCSNEFEGARLNGVVLTNDTLVTALVTPENTPINPSPWYAFKVWATKEQNLQLRISYLAGTRHRYYPKLSKDGRNWAAVKSENYVKGVVDPENNSRELPRDISIKLRVGPDTLWVAAQELETSTHVKAWIDQLDDLPYVSSTSIGQSREGRPIQSLRIGAGNDQKMLMVISRQHPPEVTGYLAMKAFIETICSEEEVAKVFRKTYTTYVVPLANPDGVDNGHWRHSSAGIDLNRDWMNVNQPEVAAIQQFMKDKSAAGGKFYFAVDFHSTWEDIYYTINPELEGNMPGLVPKMITEMGKEFTDYEPNIRPSTDKIKTSPTSSSFFFFEMGAESLTYEFGDNTPRKRLREKGAISAMKLMELMLDH